MLRHTPLLSKCHADKIGENSKRNEGRARETDPRLGPSVKKACKSPTKASVPTYRVERACITPKFIVD